MKKAVIVLMLGGLMTFGLTSCQKSVKSGVENGTEDSLKLDSVKPDTVVIVADSIEVINDKKLN